MAEAKAKTITKVAKKSVKKADSKAVVENTTEVIKDKTDAIDTPVEKVAKKAVATTKAGKHSKKAVEEAVALEAKEEAKAERKQKATAKSEQRSVHVATPKNMERAHSKSWREANKAIDQARQY